MPNHSINFIKVVGLALTAFFLCSLILCIPIIMVQNGSNLYHLCIPQEMDEALALRQFHAMITYLRPSWLGGPPGSAMLSLPDLPMSPQGKIHFQEVKDIFRKIYAWALLSAIWLLGAGGWGGWRQIQSKRRIQGKTKVKGYREEARIFAWALSIWAGLLGLITLGLGLWAAIDWTGLFVTFHKVSFHNDYWLFDPSRDPIIMYLPSEYFLWAAVAIFALIGGLLAMSLAIAWSQVKGKK